MSSLQRLARLEKTIEILGLQISPAIDGNLDDRRLLSSAAPAASEHRIRDEVKHGEDQTTEYKSSLSCCLRTLAAKDDLHPHQYKSADVEDSCLTAIAGMMNTTGGVILVGVTDDQRVIGLSPDFRALEVNSTDRWLLYLRSKILSCFIDGRVVSSHVRVTFSDVDGLLVARLAVQARVTLTFLKNFEHPKCPPRLLRRLDNQTIEVTATELEEFFEQRFASHSQTETR